MRHHTDEAILISLQKVFGGLVSMPKAELHRRLKSTPEFAYFADEMIERGLANGVLRADNGESERLSLAARPDLGRPPF